MLTQMEVAGMHPTLSIYMYAREPPENQLINIKAKEEGKVHPSILLYRQNKMHLRKSDLISTLSDSTREINPSDAIEYPLISYINCI